MRLTPLICLLNDGESNMGVMSQRTPGPTSKFEVGTLRVAPIKVVLHGKELAGEK